MELHFSLELQRLLLEFQYVEEVELVKTFHLEEAFHVLDLELDLVQVEEEHHHHLHSDLVHKDLEPEKVERFVEEEEVAVDSAVVEVEEV